MKLLISLLLLYFLEPSAASPDNITMVTTFTPDHAAIQRRSANSPVKMTVKASCLNACDGFNNSLLIVDVNTQRLTLYMKVDETRKIYSTSNATEFEVNLRLFSYSELLITRALINISLYDPTTSRAYYQTHTEYDIYTTRGASAASGHAVSNAIPLLLTVVLVVMTSVGDHSFLSWSAYLKYSTLTLFSKLLMIPLLLLLISSTFGVDHVQRIGVVMTSASPTPLEALAFGVVLGADLPLLVFLYVFTMLISNVTFPLWTLFFDSAFITPANTPFVPINVTVGIVAVLFIIGRAIRLYYPAVSDTVYKLRYLVSFCAIFFFVMAPIFGGRDLFRYVDWRILVSSVSVVITISAAVFLLVARGKEGRSSRLALGLFLVVNNTYIFYFAQRIPSYRPSDTSLGGAHGFSVVSCAMNVLLMASLCILMRDTDEKQDEPNHFTDESATLVNRNAFTDSLQFGDTDETLKHDAFLSSARLHLYN